MNKFKVTLLTSMTLAAAIASGQAWALTEGTVEGSGGLAIGSGSYAGGSNTSNTNSIAIGSGASAGKAPPAGSGYEQAAFAAIAIGRNTQSNASDGIAVGRDAVVAFGATDGLALGHSSNASVSGGLALGNNSAASRSAGTFGTATEAVSFGNVEKSGATWVSTRGVASIGSDTVSRQLTGLAAGSQDNDAVNVAQLKSLQQSSVFGQGSSIEIPASEDGSSPAVNAVNASVLGDSGKVMADAGSAFGANSQVQIGAKGAVAIGANSIATSRLDANGAAPTGYLMPSEGVTDKSVWQAGRTHKIFNKASLTH